MNSLQEEEIESLKAIFCKGGEFEVRKDREGLHVDIKFNLRPVDGRDTNQCESYSSISFYLTSEYPSELPRIMVKCLYLTARDVRKIEQLLQERAVTLQGQSMLLDLCCLTQELLRAKTDTVDIYTHKTNYSSTKSGCEECVTVSEINEQLQTQGIISANLEESRTEITKLESRSKSSSSKIKSSPQAVTVLLNLDHMRSKQNYIKLIRKWTQELRLTGKLIFCKKLILILLQGDSQAIKEYVVRNRTTNVDVDSKGRPCKERMLTVHCEVLAKTHTRLSEFSVQELPTTQSLQELFQSFTMEDLFDEYIQPLIHTAVIKNNPAHQK